MKHSQNTHFLESYYAKVVTEIKGFSIFMIDKEGLIATWTKGCEEMKGFTSEEAIGHHYKMLFPDFLRKMNQPEFELKEAEVKGRSEADAWRRKKNGDLFWAHIVLTKITDEDGQLVGFIKITQDLSKRKRAEDELHNRNLELTRINQELDNFVYTASHDLKAPISNISGLINVLETELMRHFKPEQEIFAMTKLLTHSLLKLADTLKEMASTAKDENQKEIAYQSFTEISKEIKENLRQEISESNAEIIEDFSTVPIIKYSRKNIRSVMQNLLSNSLKYRSPDRTLKILIRTKVIKGYTVLEVSDNGIGIKDEDKKRAFSMYERLDADLRNIEGTGVGLALVARIINDNGGKIEIKSKYGEGSQFKVFIKGVPSNNNL